MMDRIPVSIAGWLRDTTRREPRELTVDEKRVLWEFLRGPVFGEAVRRIANALDGKRARMDELNLMDAAQAAEATRIQGELRGAVAIFEELWETSNED